MRNLDSLIGLGAAEIDHPKACKRLYKSTSLVLTMFGFH